MSEDAIGRETSPNLDIIIDFEHEEVQPKVKVAGESVPVDAQIHLVIISNEGDIQYNTISRGTEKEFQEGFELEHLDDGYLLLALQTGRDDILGKGYYYLPNGNQVFEFDDFLKELQELESQGQISDWIIDETIGDPLSDDRVVSDTIQLEEPDVYLASDNLPEEVIVFGKHSDKHYTDMLDMAQAMENLGWSADVLRNKQQRMYHSEEENMRMWSNLAPFSIVIDVNPSGHIKEYEVLKQNRTITALLRPQESGSSWMFGDEPLVDFNYIKEFTFDTDPTEKADEIHEWAQERLEQRRDAYKEYYEYR